MGTKNNPGAFDCYNAADPDEPMFILLGRDRHAPTLARLWALLRHRSGEDETKVDEALQCAEAMDAWLGRLGKSLDEPQQAMFEKLLVAATEGLEEHPEGFEHACDCNLCRSYADA